MHRVGVDSEGGMGASKRREKLERTPACNFGEKGKKNLKSVLG